MTNESPHVHNAALDNAEMWGRKHRLTFSGVSCGHGFRSRKVTVFMDEGAIKKMIGILKLGMAVPSCHEKPITQVNEIEPNADPLPKAPPCPECEYWEPTYVLSNINCCTKYKRMRPSFSCYQPRDGAE